MPLYNPPTATATLTVQKNGTVIGSRPALNFIEGTNFTEVAADNAGTGAVDLTLSATPATGASSAPPVGTLSTSGESCVASDPNWATQGHFASNVTWPFGASAAAFIPVQVPAAITVYQLAWENGATVAGNVDVGIYDEAFSKIISSGSTAMSGVSVMQSVDIADTALAAGTYFLALVSDSATATLRFSSASDSFINRLNGMMIKTSGAFPLPATASSLAAYNSFRIPLIVASFQSAVF